MEIYLVFLIACFVIGMAKPQANLGRMVWVVLGLAVAVSIGVFVFRLV